VSRGVLDPGSGQDVTVFATVAWSFTGSTAMSWIDQMILIIDTIARSTGPLRDRRHEYRPRPRLARRV